MILGIVGSEGKKFTAETEYMARAHIRNLLTNDITKVVSGGCHLGGIDIWAVEEAKDWGLEIEEFYPYTYQWTTGYKPRNIQIASASDKVVCITVATLPSTYSGMRFPKCYHCNTDTHVKSGGCWTVKYARGIGKQGEIIVL